jgi:predicted O-methyltransferase YrrM
MKFLKKLSTPAVNLVTKITTNITREKVHRDRYNVDLVLSATLRDGRLSEVRNPVAYVEVLRGCIEHTAFSITPIKGAASSSSPAAIRFRTLLDTLRSGVPPLGFSEAQEIGLVADGLSNSLDPFQHKDKGWVWAGDVGLSFMMASSFAKKGRLLSGIIRVCRTDRCLELGTAYGMSSMFILYALRANGAEGHLTTVEGWEPQFSISSKILKERFGNSVCCRFGGREEILPSVIESLGGIDFFLHDAGHSREDYTRDFGVVIQALVPGAVVLINAIRWDDPRFRVKAPQPYLGWREVVKHPRVKQAVEIDGDLGLILVE